jgi:hypothetical protein
VETTGKKPGFPLQSFLPLRGKKGFPLQSHCAGQPSLYASSGSGTLVYAKHIQVRTLSARNCQRQFRDLFLKLQA